MACNFTGMLRANINWEVRKIIADDPKFKAFRVSSIREAR